MSARHADTIARRAELFNELIARADWTKQRDPVIDLERAAAISAVAGAISAAALAGRDPQRELIRLGGDALAWLERIDEEAAR